METHEEHIKRLERQIEQLNDALYESNSVIEAIREGAIDALVVSNNGTPQVYSMESADYTYRILIEKFGEGALSISDDGLILYCNDYFSKLIGIPANQIAGTYFSSYVEHPESFGLLRHALEDGASKGEIVLSVDGKKLHVYVSLTDLHPNVSAIGVVVTDLTQKRKHEEALVKYQEILEDKVNELNATNMNLEQFIHVISHDLKEPLRKILTYTAHLGQTRTELFTDAELKNLNVINSSALRLNSLVDDLVKYAFSAVKDDTADVDLNIVLSEVMDDLELVIKENAAQIQSEKLPVISGSKVQMRQLLANLISNAIKYGKQEISPKITLSASVSDGSEISTDGKFFKISISDNGIGMEAPHLSKIFTIFQRLHMRNQYSGNGIGLAICKKIMENHSGKIEVASTMGQGSTFNLYFPAKPHH